MQKIAMYIANTGFNLYNYRLSGMKLLSQAGWKVMAVANDEANFSDKFKQEGIKFIDIRFNDKGKNPFADLKLAETLHALYRRKQPALVHHFSSKPVIYGSIAAKLAGVPAIINTVAGLGTPLVHGGLMTLAVKKLLKIACSGRPRVIFQNQNDMHFFIKQNLIDRQRAHLIPGSGVDTKKIYPINTKQKSDALNFLLFSRMLWTKGIKEYVQGAENVKKSYPRTSFIMAGSASIGGAAANPAAIPEKWLKEINEKGQVQWTGSVPFQQMMTLVDQADVIVLPSYHPEGVPRALVEAAAKGKPIITSDMPGCKDIVRNGVNGFLVPPRNVEKLTQAMGKFIEHPEIISWMGENSRELAVKLFDESVFLDKTTRVYEKAGAL